MIKNKRIAEIRAKQDNLYKTGNIRFDSEDIEYLLEIAEKAHAICHVIGENSEIAAELSQEYGGLYAALNEVGGE